MAVLRTAAAVLGIMVLGGGSGYAAGHLAAQEGKGGLANPDPSSSVTPTQPSHTPSAPRTRYPYVPSKVPALDLDDVVFVDSEVTLTGELVSDVQLEVPRGWVQTVPGRADEVRYTKQGPEPRFIRVQAGFPMDETPLAKAERQRGNVAASLIYEQDEKIDPIVGGTMIGVDKKQRTFQTLRYTFISESQGLRLVIIRFVAFEGSPNAGVLLGVSGIPKDEKALRGVLDRATKTVVRSN